MIIRLPKWVLVNKFPSFYDTESLTSIEQTARLYGKVNELIDSYNEYVEKLNASIEEWLKADQEQEEVFAIAMRQEFQDFIDTIDLKVQALEQEYNVKVAELEKYMKTNLQQSINYLYQELKESGELQKVCQDMIAELQADVDTFKSDVTNQFDTFKSDVNSQVNTVDTKLDLAIAKTAATFEEFEDYYDNRLDSDNDRFNNLPKPTFSCTDNVIDSVTTQCNLDFSGVNVNHDYTKYEQEHELTTSDVGCIEFGSNAKACIFEVGGVHSLTPHYNDLFTATETNKSDKLSMIYSVIPNTINLINCIRHKDNVFLGHYKISPYTREDGFIIKVYTSEDKTAWVEHPINFDDGTKFGFVVRTPENHIYLKVDFPVEYSLVNTAFECVGNNIFGVTDITTNLEGEIGNINGFNIRDNKVREYIDSVMDFIVEKDIYTGIPIDGFPNTTWYYEKWNSGIVKCYGRTTTFSLDANESLGFSSMLPEFLWGISDDNAICKNISVEGISGLDVNLNSGDFGNVIGMQVDIRNTNEFAIDEIKCSMILIARWK